VLTPIVAALRDHVPWLAPVLVFGLVIFVHELGHFLAAKAAGVYAPRFSIGFGPTLWRHRWGETEYRIGILPLGGYVRMASRDDDAAALLEGGTVSGAAGDGGMSRTVDGGDPNAMLPFGPKPIPANRWFESQPLPARLGIMVAGVTMNALLALAVVIGMLAYYGLPSARSIQHSAPVIADVLPGSAAEQAGLAAGDSVAAVDGVPVHVWSDVVDRIRQGSGQRLLLGVVRKGNPLDVAVVPRSVVDTNPETGAVTSIGRIGASVRPARNPMPWPRAVAEGWSATWAMVGTTVSALHDLATGRTSLRSISGPLRIAQVSVEAARSGIEQLLTLLAFLSINVAVFNLLPIPILDGGAIVMTILESVKGGPFSMRTREYVLRAGLIAIALLFVLVMYNDRCVISFFC
jgi:regulator of sigma E protease